MGWEGWATVIALLLMMAALIRNLAAPATVLLGTLTLFMTLGIFSDKFPTPAKAVAGYGNEALITVAVLFVVAEGLTQTGAMSLLTQPILGRPRSVLSAQMRLLFPVAGLSAFLNNTTLVAMFMPVVSDWCKKTRISPSKLFIPLSYATILGGVCTLIGTSTNLVVKGLLQEYNPQADLGMFDITLVGLPCAAMGLLYIVAASRWLLPDRRSALSLRDDPRQYTVEMLVEPNSSMAGKTIEEAGLRHLSGLFLAEIDRSGQIMAAVGSNEKLEAEDRLVFVGVVESVVELQKMRGLKPATNQLFKLNSPRSARSLIEAVVSNSCPLVGKTIREGRFRSHYNAVVIAVARDGQRINKKIGDIVLHPGDTLLLEAHSSFADQQRNSRDFYLVSEVKGSTPPRHDRAWIALTILAVLVVAAGLEWISLLHGGMIASAAMILTRCCSGRQARQGIEWDVILMIGAALGIGKTIESTGVANILASGLLEVAGQHPWAALVVIYGAALLLTEILTNNAAAALVFPLAMATAAKLGVNWMPFVIVVMVAASCGFATPMGYQTHMMVYGPGGYRFSDYVRIGLPLDLLIMAVAVTVTPMVWPF